MGPHGQQEIPLGPPRAGHAPEPVPGTVYSETGINTGLEADGRYQSHYPMTGRCAGFELVIRRVWYEGIGLAGFWTHTDRKWGEA